MYFTRFTKVVPFAMLLAFNTQMGCGSTDTTGNMDPGTNPPVGQTTGYLDLVGAKAVSKDYLSLKLNVKTIEVLDLSGKWITLCSPGRLINIMDQADIDAALSAHVQLAVGHYTKIRLNLDAGGSVQLKDGSIKNLNLLAELQAGVVLDVDLTVKADASIKAVLDLDLGACIQVVASAGVDVYYFRPVFRCIDKSLFGSITGTVKARVSGEIMANVLVWAEYFDVAGRAHIELAAMTDINGRFNLDRLTLGRKYHIVVGGLVGASATFDGCASAELDLSASANVNLNVDLLLDVAVSAKASASGHVTPRADLTLADRVSLLEYLSCGTGCNKAFIVADAQAKVDVDESYYFGINAQGKFAVQSSRQRCLTGGLCTWDSLSIGADLDVKASVDLNLDITLHL